jgi:hypothetical protein
VKIKRQKPVKGGRETLPSCVIKDILRAVEKLARQHRVSRSFVVSTLLASKLGINIERYYDA